MRHLVCECDDVGDVMPDYQERRLKIALLFQSVKIVQRWKPKMSEKIRLGELGTDRNIDNGKGENDDCG